MWDWLGGFGDDDNKFKRKTKHEKMSIFILSRICTQVHYETVTKYWFSVRLPSGAAERGAFLRWVPTVQARDRGSNIFFYDFAIAGTFEETGRQMLLICFPSQTIVFSVFMCYLCKEKKWARLKIRKD